MNNSLFRECKIVMSQEWCHLQKCLNLKFVRYFSDIFIEELMNDAKVWTFFLYFNVLFLSLSMYSTLTILEIPKGWETQGVMHVVGAFRRDIYQRQETEFNLMNFIKLFQGRYHLRAEGSTTFFCNGMNYLNQSATTLENHQRNVSWSNFVCLLTFCSCLYLMS